MSGFSISGLGSGIDWSAYIASIKKAETEALSRTLGVKNQKMTNQNNVYQSMQGILDSLRSNVQGFAFSQDFLTKNVTSSDSSVVTGSATLSASNQTATIDVRQLATNEVWQGQFSNVNSSVTSSAQTLTITVRGTAHVLNVSAGTSLKSLADQINAAGIGVTANVFDTGAGGATPARISITDNNLGKYNPDQTAGINFNISISSTLTDLSTAAFGASPIVEGKDSLVRVNGGTDNIYRDNNTLTDVIPGVTLNLISADLGNAKTITVASSTSNALTKVKDFIEKYNLVVKQIRKAIKSDPNAASQGTQANPTASDSTLRTVLNNLQSAVTSSVSTLPGDLTIRALADVGITTVFNSSDPSSDTNGTLQLDESKFNNALSSSFDGVVQLFEGVTRGGVKYNGFSQKVDDAMKGILDSSTGILATKIKTVSNELLRLSSDIEKKLDRIDKKEAMLKDKFARLETVLAQLNSQGQSIQAALGQSTKKKD